MWIRTAWAWSCATPSPFENSPFPLNSRSTSTSSLLSEAFALVANAAMNFFQKTDEMQKKKRVRMRGDIRRDCEA
jgi:hypothetical protein